MLRWYERYSQVNRVLKFQKLLIDVLSGLKSSYLTKKTKYNTMDLQEDSSAYTNKFTGIFLRTFLNANL